MAGGWLDGFCSSVRTHVPAAVADKVLQGSERQDESRKAEFAEWLTGVLDRLDMLVAPDIRKRIMKKLGYDCAVQHSAHTREKENLDKCGGLAAYLDTVEKEAFACGYGVRRDKGGVVVTYRPEAMNCRCYCSVWSGLPAERTASLTYCYCAAGHQEYIWRHITQRDVDVDVTCSCINGSDHCEFVFELDRAKPLAEAGQD